MTKNRTFSIVIIFIFTLLFANVSYAERKHKRTLGLGLPLNLLNFYGGPTINYWLTDFEGILGEYSDNVGASFSYYPFGDYTGFAFRFLYSFDQEFEVAKDMIGPVHPYVSLGFASFEREEEVSGSANILGITSTSSAKVTYEGSGVEIGGGIDFNFKAIPQLYLNFGAVLTPFSLDGTTELKSCATASGQQFCFTGQSSTYEDPDFSVFNITVGLTYYFW